jgi:hypothetical protein
MSPVVGGGESTHARSGVHPPSAAVDASGRDVPLSGLRLPVAPASGLAVGPGFVPGLWAPSPLLLPSLASALAGGSFEPPSSALALASEADGKSNGLDEALEQAASIPAQGRRIQFRRLNENVRIVDLLGMKRLSTKVTSLDPPGSRNDTIGPQKVAQRLF